MNTGIPSYEKVLALALGSCLCVAPGCGREQVHIRAWHQALYAGECAPEFACYGDVEKALPLLARSRTDIDVAVPSWKIGDHSLRSLLKASRSFGVEVRAWLLLPFDHGYWPNEANVDEFTQAVKDFVSWSESENLGVSWIVVDLEPSFNYTQQFTSLLSQGDFVGAIKLLKTHINPQEYVANKGKFRDLIDFLHGRGWKAMAVTYPLVLDDLEDGAEGIQDALDIPCSGLGWDTVSFMVYLSSLQEYSPSPVGPALVYSYARDARNYFGDRAGVALGVVGPGGVTGDQDPVYSGPEVLRRDIGASMAGGIREIQVYSLEGIMDLGSAEEWVEATSVPVSVPGDEPAADFVREMMALLDRSL